MSQIDPQQGLIFPPIIPARVVRKAQQRLLSDGSNIMRERLIRTLQEADGTSATDDTDGLNRQLLCGCIPETFQNIVQCQSCLGLVCSTKHAFDCPQCGLPTCMRCRVPVRSGEQEVHICLNCAEAAQAERWWPRFRRLCWGL